MYYILLFEYYMKYYIREIIWKKKDTLKFKYVKIFNILKI